MEQVKDIRKDIRCYANERNNGNQGLFILNSKGDILYANDVAKNLLPVRPGKSFPLTLPHREREKNFAWFQDLLQGKITHCSMRSSKGQSLEICIHPVIENRKLMMFIGQITDVSRIKKIEEHAYQVLSREKQFRESVSHYFFNPIVIAKGYLHLLLQSEKNCEDKRKLEAIQEAIERIEAVVKNTVANGKIEE
jgi:sensor histidine kinase regulating citrate/malate metabolism